MPGSRRVLAPRAVLGAACALAFLAAGGARGDVVHLKGGRRLVGRVEETPSGVRVTMEGGALTIPRDQVERIERTTDPRAAVAERLAALAEGDVAGALEVAAAAEAAGMADEAGRALQRAAAAAPDDPVVRAAVFRWTAFVRRVPADPDADARLLSAFGKGGRLHLTDHFRVAHDVDPSDARRRGDLLETAYRKVYELAAKLEIDVRPLGRRLDVSLHADHASWVAAIGEPAEALRGLSGLFVPAKDRVFLFDIATMPEAGQARALVERGRTGIRDFAASLEPVRKQVDDIAAAAAAAAERRDDRRRAEAEAALAQAREALRREEARLEEARGRLATFERDVELQSERENLAATTHEACHQLAFATGLSRGGQPTWLLEGLATLFEVTGRTSFVLESPNELRLSALRAAWAAGRTSRLEDVLTDAAFLAPGADRGVAYAESWSLAYHLLRKRPAALAKLLRDGRLAAASPESARLRLEDARAALGADLAAVEREWLEDVRGLPGR